jgi:hypothetical protein
LRHVAAYCLLIVIFQILWFNPSDQPNLDLDNTAPTRETGFLLPQGFLAREKNCSVRVGLELVLPIDAVHEASNRSVRHLPPPAAPCAVLPVQSLLTFNDFNGPALLGAERKHPLTN